jgi:hypothetical protein
MDMAARMCVCVCVSVCLHGGRGWQHVFQFQHAERVCEQMNALYAAAMGTLPALAQTHAHALTPARHALPQFPLARSYLCIRPAGPRRAMPPAVVVYVRATPALRLRPPRPLTDG